MPNTYISLNALKARASLNVSGTTDNAGLLGVIEAVSREIDGITHRYFYTYAETRMFSGNGKNRMLLDWDLARITTLKEDDTLSGSYGVTFGSSDYVTWPYAADSTKDVDQARPITALEINQRTSGVQDVFQVGQRRYELAGFFGYTERIRATGAAIGASSFTASSTKVVLSAVTSVDAGDTVLVDSEQMYVESRSSSEIQVTRAMNGTTAAAHATSAALSRYIYPKAIIKATEMQASRIWARREKGYADNTVGFQESGQAGPTVTGMDRDVRNLISPYIKRFV